MSVAATFPGGGPDEVAAFLADQRQRLKPFRRVIVAADRTRVVDVNRSEVIFPGVTFGHALLESVLRHAGAAFDPATCHTPPPGQTMLKVSRNIVSSGYFSAMSLPLVSGRDFDASIPASRLSADFWPIRSRFSNSSLRFFNR